MSNFPHAKYNESLVGKIAEMFADGSSITQVAARKLGVTRQTYYTWKETYPDFRIQAELGEQLSEALHEDKLAGLADGMIEDGSAAARIFLMKNRFRESYGEQKQAPNALSAIETLLNLMNDKPAR